MDRTLSKAQEVQNKIYRKMPDKKIRPMTNKEQTEFYCNMTDEQRLNITCMFMNFGHKLEKKEDPQIILKPYD